MTFRITIAAALGGLAMLAAPCAIAGSDDYEFQAVTTDVTNGDGADLSVRLVDKRTNKPVENAIIFRTRVDMSPDDMAGMEAKHKPAPSTEPGVYRFKADLTMAGKWAVKLQAKVPGEAETIEGTVVFNAKD